MHDAYGQFVIEASTAREHLREYVRAVTRLLGQHVATTDRIGLKRARNQTAVRTASAREEPTRRLELAALDLFALGRARSREEVLTSIAAVSPAQVRAAFARMLDATAAIAIAGKIAKGEAERMTRLLGRRGACDVIPEFSSVSV